MEQSRSTKLAVSNSRLPGSRVSRCCIELGGARRLRAASSRIYDFLAGTARYKANLGTHRSTQEWLVLWRPRPGLLLEDCLRKVKWWFRNARGKSSPADQATTPERDR